MADKDSGRDGKLFVIQPPGAVCNQEMQIRSGAGEVEAEYG